MIKCDICGKECDGRLIIKDASIMQKLVVCKDCFNDYGNQNFDELIKKLKGAR